MFIQQLTIQEPIHGRQQYWSETMVGDYTAGLTHAFTLSSGVYTSFDVPTSTGFSSAMESTPAGKSWASMTWARSTKAYIRNGSTYSDLVPFAGSSFTQALSINDAGHVVGSYRNASNVPQGFLYDGSSYQTLVFPGSTATTAIGINNADDVVGTFVSSMLRHGYFYDGSTYTQLDVPGANFTVAEGINDWADRRFVSRQPR